MRVLVFLNSLGLGGTEKAACIWATRLRTSIGSPSCEVRVVSLQSGPRLAPLTAANIPVHVVPREIGAIEQIVQICQPDVIHAHCPGYPHPGDILGEVLAHTGGIPVIQTNIFGRLQNPAEAAWTRFRLFISWTSCVQAARRAGLSLNREFFRFQSVASYPVEDPWKDSSCSSTLTVEAQALRHSLNIAPDEVLFGRFSRPEPNKWTEIPLQGFALAATRNSKIRLLLREPPPEISRRIGSTPLGSKVSILPATGDAHELAVSQMACDAILHGSSMGESFGYGIAEPMALGKPIIANSTPWLDQAQIELVRPGECGFLASSAVSTADAVLRLAGDVRLREALGNRGRQHILTIADAETSMQRVRMALECAVSECENPHQEEDLESALEAASYLDRHQWGASWRDRVTLRTKSLRVAVGMWRRSCKSALRRALVPTSHEAN